MTTSFHIRKDMPKPRSSDIVTLNPNKILVTSNGSVVETGVLNVYDTSGEKYLSFSHNGTNSLIQSSSGDLILKYPSDKGVYFYDSTDSLGAIIDNSVGARLFNGKAFTAYASNNTYNANFYHNAVDSNIDVSYGNQMMTGASSSFCLKIRTASSGVTYTSAGWDIGLSDGAYPSLTPIRGAGQGGPGSSTTARILGTNQLQFFTGHYNAPNTSTLTSLYFLEPNTNAGLILAPSFVNSGCVLSIRSRIYTPTLVTKLANIEVGSVGFDSGIATPTVSIAMQSSGTLEVNNGTRVATGGVYQNLYAKELRTYGSGNTANLSIKHDNTNAIIQTSSGNIHLLSNINYGIILQDGIIRPASGYLYLHGDRTANAGQCMYVKWVGGATEIGGVSGGFRGKFDGGIYSADLSLCTVAGVSASSADAVLRRASSGIIELRNFNNNNYCDLFLRSGVFVDYTSSGRLTVSHNGTNGLIQTSSGTLQLLGPTGYGIKVGQDIYGQPILRPSTGNALAIHGSATANDSQCLKVVYNAGITELTVVAGGLRGYFSNGITIGDFSTVINKVKTGTATLDFPSISPNSHQELTIAVTGAAVGDCVFLAIPSTIESGLIANGYVSAADTVTVRLANISTISIDPASASWRATIMNL